jgi:hypothetical protein
MTENDSHPSNRHDRPFRRYAVATAKLAGLVLGLAVLVHVSWNMFAPDMFDFEAIQIKQALGLVVFAGVFAFMFRFVMCRKYRSSGS